MVDWEHLYVKAAEESPEQARGVEYAHRMWERVIMMGDDFNQNPHCIRSNAIFFQSFFPEASVK